MFGFFDRNKNQLGAAKNYESEDDLDDLPPLVNSDDEDSDSIKEDDDIPPLVSSDEEDEPIFVPHPKQTKQFKETRDSKQPNQTKKDDDYSDLPPLAEPSDDEIDKDLKNIVNKRNNTNTNDDDDLPPPLVDSSEDEIDDQEFKQFTKNQQQKKQQAQKIVVSDDDVPSLVDSDSEEERTNTKVYSSDDLPKLSDSESDISDEEWILKQPQQQKPKPKRTEDFLFQEKDIKLREEQRKQREEEKKRRKEARERARARQVPEPEIWRPTPAMSTGESRAPTGPTIVGHCIAEDCTERKVSELQERVEVTCTDKCFLLFHKGRCWKKQRPENLSTTAEEPCPTPDCCGKIVRIRQVKGTLENPDVIWMHSYTAQKKQPKVEKQAPKKKKKQRVEKTVAEREKQKADWLERKRKEAEELERNKKDEIKRQEEERKRLEDEKQKSEGMKLSEVETKDTEIEDEEKLKKKKNKSKKHGLPVKKDPIQPNEPIVEKPKPKKPTPQPAKQATTSLEDEESRINAPGEWIQPHKEPEQPKEEKIDVRKERKKLKKQQKLQEKQLAMQLTQSIIVTESKKEATKGVRKNPSEVQPATPPEVASLMEQVSIPASDVKVSPLPLTTKTTKIAPTEPPKQVPPTVHDEPVSFWISEEAAIVEKKKSLKIDAAPFTPGQARTTTSPIEASAFSENGPQTGYTSPISFSKSPIISSYPIATSQHQPYPPNPYLSYTPQTFPTSPPQVRSSVNMEQPHFDPLAHVINGINYSPLVNNNVSTATKPLPLSEQSALPDLDVNVLIQHLIGDSDPLKGKQIASPYQPFK